MGNAGACCGDTAGGPGPVEVEPVMEPKVNLSGVRVYAGEPGKEQAFGGEPTKDPDAAPAPASVGAPPQPAFAEADEQGAGQLVLNVHSAELFRGFSSLGALDKMSPYAVVAFDKMETCRTPAAKNAHKTPTWNFEYANPESDLPQEISIAVWDKNNFHRDVLCGVITLPIAPDMLDFERRECTLQKKAKKTGEWVDTGKLILSVKVPHANVAEIESRERALTEKSLGNEIDSIISFASSKGGDRNRGKKITLTQVHVPVDDSGRSADDDGDDVEAPTAEATPAPVEDAGPMTRTSKIMPALMGSWKCVATQGLEEFLLASGVGMFQRKIAKAAAWPKWEFTPQGESVLFVNHTAIGVLKETIPLGSEYVNKDGHGNPLTCNATWTRSDQGGTLLIRRSGVLSGKKTELTEERTVAGDKLEFTLTSNEISWGRSFVRE